MTVISLSTTRVDFEDLHALLNELCEGDVSLGFNYHGAWVRTLSTHAQGNWPVAR